MSTPACERTERAIADRLGGQRVPISGRARGDAPDVAHPRLSIEIKHRRSLPAWPHEAIAQAVAAAGAEHIPIAILHGQGRRYDENLCVLRLAGLAALLASGARDEG